MKNLISRTLITTFIIIITSISCSAQTRLAPIFGDNMVMQQATNASIWGWDKAGLPASSFRTYKW